SLVCIGWFVKETIKYPNGIVSEPVLGGPSVYSSIVARKLGIKTGIVTKKGEDLSEKFLNPLYQIKVDLRGLKTEGPHSTTIQLVYDTSGDKELIYLKKAPEILFSDIPREYHNAPMFYICPINYDVPIETVRSIHKAGIALAVDLGGYGGVHCEKNFKIDPEIVKKIVSYSYITKASDEDCRRLFGIEKGEEENIAKLLLKWGAAIAIITCGERGAIALTKEDFSKVPGFPGKVIDTTGGGDSFAAGFLVEYLRSKNVQKSLIFASATAVLVISRTGGVTVSRMPTLKEVDHKIFEYEKSIEK
ncbi:MAG: carbohydrate kinase family protein, partial [Actinobacteria bacterium]|nr:carbohydrate kinase family protein [Actinomycetota bacterium]